MKQKKRLNTADFNQPARQPLFPVNSPLSFTIMKARLSNPANCSAFLRASSRLAFFLLLQIQGFHPFTAPVVNPSTIWLLKILYTAMVGAIAMIMAANICT